jgi:hypothetical protein
MQQLNQQTFSGKRIGIEKSWDPTEDLWKKEEESGSAFPKKRGFSIKKRENTDALFSNRQITKELRWT